MKTFEQKISRFVLLGLCVLLVGAVYIINKELSSKEGILSAIITPQPASGGGTPGGSSGQLQYNNAGALGGISGATSDGATVTFATGSLIATDLKADGSAGLSILNSSGTSVALFGAGPGTGISLNGTTNIGSASTDYIQIAGGTGTTTLTATGGSTNINISLVPKGTTGQVMVGAGTVSNVALTFGSAGVGTGFYSTGVNELSLAIAGTRRWSWQSNSIRGIAGAAAAPNFTTIADPDTGMWVGTGVTGFTTDATDLGRFTVDGSLSGLLVGTTTPFNPSGITVTRGQFYNSSINTNVLSIGGGAGSGNTFAVFNAASTAQQIRLGFITTYSVFDFVNNQGLVRSSANLTHDVATASAHIWSLNNVATELMRLNSTGLGIGIAPVTTFHVHKASANSQIQITDGTSGSAETDGLELGTNFSDGTMYIWNNEATALRFGTNNSERVRIDSSGNVGIGTGATVSAKLHTLATTEQLRLGYDASKYFSTTISSVGSATLNLIGTSPTFTFSDPVIFSDRAQQKQGSNIASANDITLGAGNYFVITSTTTINRIATSSWQAGSVVTLQLPSSITLANSVAGGGGFGSVRVSNAGDLTTLGVTVVNLLFNGTEWDVLSVNRLN